MFYQQICVCLAIADIISTSSWFIGPKYTASFFVCSVQEYMFQAGHLIKAFLTVTICAVSLYMIHFMRSPLPKIQLVLVGCPMVIPVVSLVVSIMYRTSELYCGNSGSDNIFDHQKYEPLTAYLCAVMLPIQICVAVDYVMYVLVHRRAQELEGPSVAPTADSTPESRSQLYSTVQKLKFYPLVFAICWLPREIAILIEMNGGRQHNFLWALSAIFLSSSGTAIAANYFTHQRVYPDIRAFLLLPSVFADTSRNLSSILYIESWKTTSSVSSRNSNIGDVSMHNTTSILHSSLESQGSSGQYLA